MINRLDASRSNDEPPSELCSGSLRDLLGLKPSSVWRPYIMGTVAATPDCAARARKLISDGADIVNVVGAFEAQVAQAVAAVAALGVPVSADADRVSIAVAALDAGARLINQVGGDAGNEIAAAVNAAGAVLVVSERAEAAADHVICDRGPSATDSPDEAIAALRRLREPAAKPLLLAIDRIDLLGAEWRSDPLEHDAAALAALSAGLEAGVLIVRTHDVAGAADYMTVRAALNGQLEVDAGLVLAENKRRVDEGSKS